MQSVYCDHTASLHSKKSFSSFAARTQSHGADGGAQWRDAPFCDRQRTRTLCALACASATNIMRCITCYEKKTRPNASNRPAPLGDWCGPDRLSHRRRRGRRAGADGAGTGTYERWEAQFVPWLSVVPGSHDRCPCPRSPQIAVHERQRGRFCDGMRGRIDKLDAKGIATGTERATWVPLPPSVCTQDRR